MPDKLEKIGHSLVQHGDENRRVYLIKLDERDMDRIIPHIERLARENRYEKILCKVPEWGRERFKKGHFQLRATIPGFYQGKEPVYFMVKFPAPRRMRLTDEHRRKIQFNLDLAKSKASDTAVSEIPSHCTIRRLKVSDADSLARLYDRVYDSYPFPITEPAYLRKTMKTHVDYFGIFLKTTLIAAASGEKDLEAANAEMTDFATLPDYRGKGLATALLCRMESEMKRLKIRTLYTIARALSPGMNITFARCGYHFSGTLINNTQIAGQIESMNVWYKQIG